MQIDNMYVAIGLHNFIKSHSRNKEDIYYTLTNVLDDISNNSGVIMIQSSLAQINKLWNKIAIKI